MAKIFNFHTGKEVEQYLELTPADLEIRKRGRALLELMEQEDISAYEASTLLQTDV